MKKLLILLAIIACRASVRADDSASGIVVDRHGTPIPGVKISGRNGEATAITDMTGRFAIDSDSLPRKLTAIYPGYQSVSKRAGKEMIITLSPRTWWNAVPDHYQWFGGITVTTPTASLQSFKDSKNPAYGIRVGILKEWGAYANVSTSFCFESGEPSCSGDFYAFESEADFSTFLIGVGGIRRLWSPFHLYAGIGYINSNCVYDCFDETEKETTMRSCKVSSVYGEAGIMFRVNSFMINAGIIFHPELKPDTPDTDISDKELFVPNSSAMRSTGIQFGIHYIF